MESNHQGLSATDLQSAEPTALLNAGVKVLECGSTPRLPCGRRFEREVPALSDEPFRAKPERRGVEVETDRSRTGILRLQGGRSPVELRPRFHGSTGLRTPISALRTRRSPG